MAIVFATSSGNILYLFGAEYFPSIIDGELWRLVLPMFLHANILHLFVNMWALLTIGYHIENFYGSKKLFVVYVLSGIAGSLASVIVTFATLSTRSIVAGEGFSISIGASGAIFGLVGLLLGNGYKNDTFAQRIPVNSSNLWIFVGFNLLFGFGVNGIGGPIGINNAAHIGGLIGGFLLGLYLDPVNAYYQSPAKTAVEKLLFPICLAIVLLSVIFNIISYF